MAELNRKTKHRRNEAVCRTVDEKTDNKKPCLDKDDMENPYLSDIKQERIPQTVPTSVTNQ